MTLARTDLARRVIVGIALAASAVLLAAPGAGAGSLAARGMESRHFWALAGELEMPKVAQATAGVYQPNTDELFLNFTKQAKARPIAGGKAWRNVGPYGGLEYVPGTGNGNELRGNAGGIGTAIAVDPSDASGNTVYLGTLGGLYKSTDGGKTIVNLSDGKLDRVPIGAIAVDPKDPKTVYAGSGVAINTLSDDAAGTGVYVSRDAGKTFTRPALNTHGYGVNAITVNPATRTVLVGTNYGLWRSTDLGGSFTKIALPTNAAHTGPAATPLGSTVSAIVRHRSNPAQVTLAVGWARGKETLGDGSVIGTGNGLYRSANDGASFTFMESTGDFTWPGASSDPVGRVALAYGSADGAENHMWALVSDAGRAAGSPGMQDVVSGLPASPMGTTTLNGLYRSTDNGETWVLQATAQTFATAVGATTPAALYALYAAGVQSTFNLFVETDPTNANRVWVGLEEVYQGDLRAEAVPAPTTTWTAIAKYADICGFASYLAWPGGNGVPCPSQVPFYGGVTTTHPDQHAIAIARTPQGIRMYEGNDGGWWVQDAHALADGTTGFDNTSWRSLNLPPTVLPWDVTFLKDGSVALALQDNGTVRIRGNGTAYQACGGDGVFVWPGKDGSSMYCGVPGLLILATTDDWRTTINISPGEAPGTTGVTGASFLSPWAVDPEDTDHILAAGGVIMETLDGPASNTMDPTQTVLLDTTWETVFTPPASPAGKAWDSSAMYVKGDVAYVGMCSLCRPAFSIKTIADPRQINPRIATNVKPGCAEDCWHMAASKGLPHQQIGDIVADAKDPRTIYVTLRQYLVMSADPKVTGDQKVMMSRDAGETLTDITGDLPRVDVHGIALRNGQLIVANDVGIFTASAGSKRWSRLGVGLPEVPFRSMKMDDSGRYVLAGAYGRGAWVYDFGAPAGTAPGPKKPTQVNGVRKTLPATGAESNVVFALGALMAAALISRRLRTP